MYNTVILFVFTIFGVVFGSFYNVVLYRIPNDIPISKGRSMCAKCGHPLNAADLVPIFSWLFLGGRCRYCKDSISAQYPVIELVTGLLFALAWLTQPSIIGAVFYSALWSMLLIVAIMDFKSMLIAESVLAVFSVLFLACILWLKQPITSHLLGGFLGFGVYLAIYLIAKAFYKKEAFGFGDVELMASIGFALGLRGSVETMLLSFYISVMGIIIMKLLGKAVKSGIEIPFGPYMCIAAFAASLFEQPIYDLYIRLIKG
ncbi:MAG: prepilin peptidase [Clostridiales bacterium]|jgi:leader peptidase (prepilin peptidase)/N-methyltransferase|nr:prepilin peptidase [Clostridiales bacterium]